MEFVESLHVVRMLTACSLSTLAMVTINTSYFHPAHQHYTDEAQKAETVPSVVTVVIYIYIYIQQECHQPNTHDL